MEDPKKARLIHTQPVTTKVAKDVQAGGRQEDDLSERGPISAANSDGPPSVKMDLAKS